MVANRDVSDNRWYRWGTKVLSVLLLNLTWLICSLPLVTLPVSTAALFSTVRSWSEGDERIIAPYFAGWRRLWRKSYVMGVPALSITYALYIEVEFYSHRLNFLGVAMLAICGVVALVLLAGTAYAGPVLAAVDSSSLNVIRIAIYLGLRRLPVALFLILPLWAASITIIVRWPIFLFVGTVPVIVWITSRLTEQSIRLFLDSISSR